MKIDSKSFHYSPISHSNISLIYPWNDWIIDLLALIPNCKLRKERMSFLEKIFCHQNIFLTNSGSAALTLAIQSLNLPPDSEVLITSFNCPAVIDSIISANATPVLIDINPCLGIDLGSAKEALSKKTKAIIVTNIYGLADNFSLLEKFCRDNNLYLINDLAQTFDNLNSKSKLNKYGDISIYSFGPEKHLFSLGGGCMMVNNTHLLKAVKKLYPKKVNENAIAANFFLRRCLYYLKFIIHRFFPQLIHFNSKKMEIDIVKPNIIDIYQISNCQLFSLVHKLLKYNKYYVFTQKNFELLCSNLKYDVIFNKGNYISLPLYATIKVNVRQRYDIATYLDKHNISSTWNYLPLNYYAAYKKYKIVGKKYAEEMWKKVLSIPFRYPADRQKIEEIINIINSY